MISIGHMNLIVKKTYDILSGSVTPPSSKSQSIRGLIFALLAKGKSTLTNILYSDDVQDAINVCQLLGAEISISDNTLGLMSFGLPIRSITKRIYSGNSGITTCFVMPLLGLRQNALSPIVLDCGDQMRARSTQSLVDALNNLGLNIKYIDKLGFLPISISGSLQGGNAEISGINSQFLSALLISLPCAPLDSKIIVKDLHERPYVKMTLNWLRQHNIIFDHEKTEDRDIYYIKGGQKYSEFHTNIASDFSSASYLIAAAVLNASHVELHGLCMGDSQGDKRLVTILQKMGADIQIAPSKLIINGGKKLKGIEIDANDIPDLLPTLAVIGTYAEGKTDITNVEHARLKETDRIHSITEGLMSLGAKVDEYKDSITVYQSSMRGARVKGYGDHRTVMALSIAGMLADGTTAIDGAEAINKTFPEFVKTMRLLGANMKLMD